MMWRIILHAFASTTFCLAGLANAAGKAATFPQGSQYIRFSGTVDAKVSWEKNIVPAGVDVASCYPFTTGQHQRSHLYVGVNPPWDKNPFFFELHHLISSDCSTYFCQSSDTITNLYFASASYECFDGNKLCYSFAPGDRYMPKIYLDLGAGRAQVQQTQVGGQPGYVIKGGPDTWIGDVDGNQVDVRADCQWVTGTGTDARVGGYSWLHFVWNKTSPFDYDVAFSNSSAAATLTTKMFSQSLKRVISTMTLSFEGSRNDTPEGNGLDSYHDLNPIQLHMGNATVPEFRFVNGSRIYFGTGKQGWTAAATPLPQTSAVASVSIRPSSSSSTLATTTSSSRNAAPTRGPRSDRTTAVTVVVVKAMVYVLGMI